MKNLIFSYDQSCKMVKKRIAELTSLKNTLSRKGMTDQIDELDLERRLRLLYEEHQQMQEIISYLKSYARRVEQRAET